MKTFKTLSIAFTLMALFAVSTLCAQDIQKPRIYAGTGLFIKNTAGYIYNGGHRVAVAAATTAIADSQTSCAAPAYTACNFMVADSSGTVSVSQSAVTALTSGNTLLALIETTGGVITRLAAANQSDTNSLSSIKGLNTYFGGTTSTYTPVRALIVHSGTVALGSASPSTVTVTGLSPAYTSTSTFTCSANLTGSTAAIAAMGVAVTLTSSSSVTFTSANSQTLVVNYMCVGY